MSELAFYYAIFFMLAHKLLLSTTICIEKKNANIYTCCIDINVLIWWSIGDLNP